MRRRLLVALTVAASVILPVAAQAQSTTTGAIAGEVKDTTGAVLPGVTVEAASPALIEKVRTVVTDSQGQYKIVDLRPGAYTITFTLPGFATVRREGLELTTGFTAPANAELRVGSLEETVTVSGASPVVDVQNVRSQNVLSREVLDTIPTSKSISGYAALTVGMTVAGGLQDVGGNRSDQYGFMGIHGIRVVDGKQNQDGMRVNNMTYEGSGQYRQYIANQAGVQEIVLETAGMSSESQTGGVHMNIVPKDGGNTFQLYVNAAYSGKNLQNTNLSDDLRARGLTQAAKLKQASDFGVGLGGPIQRERLWFYTAHRWWRAEEYIPGNFYNATQGQYIGGPGSGVSPYTPDLAQQAYTSQPQADNTLRLTWQAAQKHKLTLSANIQRNCNCKTGVNALRSPEAAYDAHFVPTNVFQTTWSHPATNRLLFQAGATAVINVNVQEYATPFVTPADISITELSTNFTYNSWATALGPASYGKAIYSQHNERFSMSYVTGSHAFKVGLFTLAGVNEFRDTFINRSLSYQFRNQVPVSLTQWASPGAYKQNAKLELGLYAQDQWTLRRLTLNLGARFDYLNAYVPAQVRPAGVFVPALDVERIENVPNFTDISPRLGAAYDLFGDAKTALKVSVGRYVVPHGTGIASIVNPANALVLNAVRTWNDANGNYIPECDVSNQGASGECGAISNNRFGTVNLTTRYAQDALEGFGQRGYNWQISTGIQHELRPGMALNVSYFRNWYNNLTATDNVLVGPADFDPFCVTAPSDARLPGGGGNQLCGLYDVTPSKFGLVDNLVTQASHFGKQTEMYNGVDATLNVRFGQGLLQGGMATGSRVTDNCFVVDSPQQQRPGYCHVSPPWSAGTQVKFSGFYPLPWDLQTSVTYQNLPGLPILATQVYTSADIRASLGRNLAAGPNGTVLVDLIEPNTVFEDRLNQLDVRFTKLFRLMGVRVQGNFDIYNILNGSAILTENARYGPTWLQPTQILSARTFKFGAQLNF